MNHPMRNELLAAGLLRPATDIENSAPRSPLHTSTRPCLRMDDSGRQAAASRVELARKGVADTELEGMASSNHRSGYNRDAMCAGLTALAESRRKGM